MKRNGADMSKIVYKKGNAIDALKSGEIDYLIHQCNSKGVMGAGIAKEIKARVPEAFAAYKNEYVFFSERFGRNLPLGSCTTGGGVINLVAQTDFGNGGRYTNYGALASAFCSLFNGVQDFDLRQPSNLVIGVPKYIGCGLGGGDWDVVLELIKHCLTWCKQVIIYEL